MSGWSSYEDSVWVWRRPEAVAGTFGIQPLDGAFRVPYQAAEPRDERHIRVPLRICSEMSQGEYSTLGSTDPPR